MKPVIALVADVPPSPTHVRHVVQQKYLDAVAAGADAIALILPARINAPASAWMEAEDLPSLLSRLDGVCLTGATSNVSPAQYGAVQAEADSPIDLARDAVSLRLVRLCVARGLPVLGICRGAQEINVALGGTLHQAVDAVPGLADHREDASLPLAEQYAPVHEVSFVADGMLRRLTGIAGTRVNSLHGQGVDRLAPRLVVEARAPDGLVEAFRLEGEGFVLGVQWHPEWEFRADPVSRAILREFGTAARRFHRTSAAA